MLTTWWVGQNVGSQTGHNSIWPCLFLRIPFVGMGFPGKLVETIHLGLKKPAQHPGSGESIDLQLAAPTSRGS